MEATDTGIRFYEAEAAWAAQEWSRHGRRRIGGGGIVVPEVDIAWEKEGAACATAHDVHQRILTDDGTLPHFSWASQNIAAATALLHGLPEAAMSEDRRARREIRTLLERAAAQQAESLMSRRRELNTS